MNPTEETLPLDVAPPRLRTPRKQAMFGDINGGGEFGNGGCESMCSIGVIGEIVRVMSMGSLSYVGGGGGTLGGAMEDEEVALVDVVFKGAFGALGDKSWCFSDGVLVSS
ncbi:hypothetical protein Tco_1081155 [Tanacetum coccineum]|uniref:Uncharacterized protein n=1 Tax=Tanacetum coccineum TaxID=301880 RepID=A0ABQ5HY99_9ASTR